MSGRRGKWIELDWSGLDRSGCETRARWMTAGQKTGKVQSRAGKGRKRQENRYPKIPKESRFCKKSFFDCLSFLRQFSRKTFSFSSHPIKHAEWRRDTIPYHPPAQPDYGGIHPLQTPHGLSIHIPPADIKTRHLRHLKTAILGIARGLKR